MNRKTLPVFLLFLFSLHVTFAQTTKRIDLELQNATLKEFMSAIEKAGDFTFMYNNIDPSKTDGITVSAKQKTIDEILRTVLPPKKLSYQIIGRQIILKEVKETAFSAVITGRVADAAGNAMTGVSVVAQGTSTGTVTNADGRYTIVVSDAKAQLRFSYLGYDDQVVPVGNLRTLDITLTEKSESLDNVVVIGYGSVKKTSLAAAVSTMKGAEIAMKPITNLSNGLVGNMPGIIAQQSSGEPGVEGSTIRVRGSSTTGNGDPLIIVDGVQRSFSQLDPSSIESFTVLKDAAAVAPYGMGGANGVILVTTKRGKTGAPTLSYNGYTGIQNPTRMPEMVNSYQYTLLQNEGAMNSGLLYMPYSDAQIEQYYKTVSGASDADPDRYPNSRGLRDVIRRNALINKHDLQLSGGTDKFHYYTSLGYQASEGQFDNIWSKRYNGQLSIDIQATNTTKVAASVTGYVTNYTFPGKVDWSAGSPNEVYTAGNGGILYQAFRTPPTSAIWYSNGLWGSYLGKSLVGYINSSGYAQRDNTQIYTTFSIDQQLPFLEGLSVKGLVAYDPTFYNRKVWQTPVASFTPDFTSSPVEYIRVETEFSNPQLNEEFSQTQAFTYQAHLNYHNTFCNKHDVSFLFVAEARQEKWKGINAERKNYLLSIDEIGMGGVAQGDINNGGGSWQTAQAGFVYRLAYNYNGKYFAEFSGRYDGSYYFAPGKRWGFFPSYAVAWNISQEPFMQKLDWINMLKVRSSYGSSGKLAGESFQYLSGYETYGGAAYFNGASTIGLYEKEPQANPEITWEKAKKFNVGVDVALWNGLLNLQADYFYEKRSDMLWQPSVLVPVEYGTSMPDVNSAKMSNQGVELSLSSSYRINKDLTVRLAGNFTYARNKIIEIFETSSTYDNPNRRRTGRSWGTQFGLKALGYYTPDDFNPDGSPNIPSIPDAPVGPGDLKYADLSGPNGVPDGIIDSNDETVIGHPNGMPQFIYGFSPSITWKDFDLNVLFQGAARYSLPVSGSLVWPFFYQGSASERSYRDHWTPTNTNALYPKVYSNQPDYNTRYSSWWCRDASYLRIKNLEVGYTLPSKISKKFFVQRFRVYLSGQNLWTWTPNMKETIDPEAQNSSGQYYYQQQVFSAGVNITF